MIGGNRPHPLLSMLGGLALLLAIAAVGLYMAGWLMFDNGSDTATIQIKTGEIKQAAEKAVDQGRAVLDDAVKPDSDPATAPAANSTSPPDGAAATREPVRTETVVR
jgi:hypothetical protein